MPTLRIYYDAFFDAELEDIEKKIETQSAYFNEKYDLLQSGFYNKSSILQQVLESYYVANYIDKGSKSIPSINSELAYFNFVEGNSESEEKIFPILIKLIFNKKFGILCFYSKQIIRNREANALIRKLQTKYGFNFKFSLVNNHHVFRRNELNVFLNVLDISDFTAISVYDADNELIVKNNTALTKTKKVLLFLDEVFSGNWSYVRLINAKLEFEIRLSNNKTQNYLTFENKYIDDIHLVKVIDYLTKKIKEAEKASVLNEKKQTCLDYYQKLVV